MRDYLKKVLQLVKPYRLRFGLGLLCGFLSGVLAPTLGLSLKLAVDAVFPPERGATSSMVAATSSSAAPATDAASPATTTSLVAAAPVASPSGLGPAKAGTTNGLAAAPGASLSGPAKKGLASGLPAPLKKKLDSLAQWFRPADHPSTLRLALVIGFIPAAMFLRSLLAYLNIYLLVVGGDSGRERFADALVQAHDEPALGLFRRDQHRGPHGSHRRGDGRQQHH